MAACRDLMLPGSASHLCCALFIFQSLSYEDTHKLDPPRRLLYQKRKGCSSAPVKCHKDSEWSSLSFVSSLMVGERGRRVLRIMVPIRKICMMKEELFSTLPPNVWHFDQHTREKGCTGQTLTSKFNQSWLALDKNRVASSDTRIYVNVYVCVLYICACMYI